MNKPSVILSLGADTSKEEKEVIEGIFKSDDYSLEVRLSIIRASGSKLSLLIDTVIFNIASNIVWDTVKVIYKKLVKHDGLKDRPLELQIRRTWGEVSLNKNGFYARKGEEQLEFKSLESIIEYAKTQEEDKSTK